MTIHSMIWIWSSFTSNSVHYYFSLDASTNHLSRLGRFLNDSPKRLANCAPKAMIIAGKPRVVIFATKHIMSGTELRYDYGGRNLPWRKVGVWFVICWFTLARQAYLSMWVAGLLAHLIWLPFRCVAVSIPCYHETQLAVSCDFDTCQTDDVIHIQNSTSDMIFWNTEITITKIVTDDTVS